MESSSSGASISEINVTPLVDVMLVVLIIFMVVTPLLQQGTGVALPEARNVMSVPDESDQIVTVAIRANGALFLGTEPMDARRLERVLAIKFGSNPNLQLQIKADRQVRYGQVKNVIRLGREIGFAGAALIAEEWKEVE